MYIFCTFFKQYEKEKVRVVQLHNTSLTKDDQCYLVIGTSLVAMLVTYICI